MTSNVTPTPQPASIFRIFQLSSRAAQARPPGYHVRRGAIVSVSLTNAPANIVLGLLVLEAPEWRASSETILQCPLYRFSRGPYTAFVTCLQNIFNSRALSRVLLVGIIAL